MCTPLIHVHMKWFNNEVVEKSLKEKLLQLGTNDCRFYLTSPNEHLQLIRVLFAWIVNLVQLQNSIKMSSRLFVWKAAKNIKKAPKAFLCTAHLQWCGGSASLLHFLPQRISSEPLHRHKMGTPFVTVVDSKINTQWVSLLRRFNSQYRWPKKVISLTSGLGLQIIALKSGQLSTTTSHLHGFFLLRP